MTMKEFFKKMFDEADDRNKAEIAHIMSNFVSLKDITMMVKNGNSLTGFINAHCSMHDEKIGFYNGNEFVAVFICKFHMRETELIPTEAFKEFLDTIECKKLATEFSYVLLKERVH